MCSTVNDYSDIHNRLDVYPENDSLPDALLDTGLTTTEITQALADLDSLGLVTGISVAERKYPIVILGLTPRGRQELP